jgi:hypothetical protein
MGGTAVAGSAPGSAAAAPAPAEGAAAAAVADGDKIICRSIQGTGSRFPERVCMTKKQMAEERDRARRGADRFMDRSRTGNVGSGGKLDGDRRRP